MNGPIYVTREEFEARIDGELDSYTSYLDLFMESFLDMVANGLAVLTVFAIFLIGYRLITGANLIAEITASLSR